MISIKIYNCHHLADFWLFSNYVARGGHSHWKGVWGCAAVMTPFFRASCRSLAHQFTLNAPLLCPLFSIFRKFLHFQPCFGQNYSSLDPNFSKFSFPRPPFFQENPLPRLYILKPAWHTPTKKKVECPPPGLCGFSPYIQSLSIFIKTSSFPGGYSDLSWTGVCHSSFKTHTHL